MEKENFEFKWRNKEFNLEVSRVPWWKEGVGLMFVSKKKAKSLLFDLKKEVKMSIHSYFVKFSFIAIWLDKDKKIIEIKQIQPYRGLIKPKRPFRYLIEIPITENYDAVVRNLVERRKI